MNKKILIIDDEKDIVELLKLRLEASGYEVITASGGREGLDKLNSETPDLVFLDIMMPEIDGFEVLHRIRSRPETKATPVVMLTCRGETDSIVKARDLGSTDYIIKPFDAKDILEIVERYI